MVILSPTTSAQEFNVVPRNPNELSSLTLTITEEESKNSETFEDITAYVNGDYICISQAFSILQENRLYKISITQDGSNWWRGKARCTSQTDYTTKHNLHAVAESEYISISSDESYTTLP